MKKAVPVFWIGFFLAVTLAAAGAGEEQAERGRALYAQKCVICHGAKGNGEGPAAASFRPKPPDFATSAFWQRFDEKAIADVITNGHGQMPAFHLKPEDNQAIVDYMVHAFKLSQ